MEREGEGGRGRRVGARSGRCQLRKEIILKKGHDFGHLTAGHHKKRFPILLTYLF
jgi:hypothetical protein